MKNCLGIDNNKINSYRISKRSNKDRKKSFLAEVWEKERAVDGVVVNRTQSAQSEPWERGMVDLWLPGHTGWRIAGTCGLSCCYLCILGRHSRKKASSPTGHGVYGRRKGSSLVLDALALVPVWELNLLRAAVFLANWGSPR